APSPSAITNPNVPRTTWVDWLNLICVGRNALNHSFAKTESTGDIRARTYRATFFAMVVGDGKVSVTCAHAPGTNTARKRRYDERSMLDARQNIVMTRQAVARSSLVK